MRTYLTPIARRLQPLRVKRDVPPDADGWLRATFRLEALEGVTIDVLSLGPHIEVLEPPELRASVSDRARRTARLYRETSAAG